MEKEVKKKFNLREYVLCCIWAPALVAQFILVLFFEKVSDTKSDMIMYIGWAIWLISVVFGIYPILAFKIKGGVAKGKNYMETTKLVDTGLYSILRHPQYVAGLLLALALILISQTWLSTILGVVVLIFLYIDILRADKEGLDKFGDEYREYMKKVPRMNFILGIIRKLRRKSK